MNTKAIEAKIDKLFNANTKSYVRLEMARMDGRTADMERIARKMNKRTEEIDNIICDTVFGMSLVEAIKTYRKAVYNGYTPSVSRAYYGDAITDMFVALCVRLLNKEPYVY